MIDSLHAANFGYTKLYLEAKKIFSSPGFWSRGLSDAIVKRALEEIGKGELIRNNYGSELERYGVGAGENWCAAFVWTVVDWACADIGVENPLEDIRRSERLVAKALFRNVIANGMAIEGRDVRSGDIVCWQRGKPGSWKGHIGIVTDPTAPNDGIFRAVQGNVGRFPAKVDVFDESFGNPRLIGFARLTVEAPWVSA